MRILYTINLIAKDDPENHTKIDKYFKDFISNLHQASLIDDYGYKLVKVDDLIELEM